MLTDPVVILPRPLAVSSSSVSDVLQTRTDCRSFQSSLSQVGRCSQHEKCTHDDSVWEVIQSSKSSTDIIPTLRISRHCSLRGDHLSSCQPTANSKQHTLPEKSCLMENHCFLSPQTSKYKRSESYHCRYGKDRKSSLSHAKHRNQPQMTKTSRQNSKLSGSQRSGTQNEKCSAYEIYRQQRSLPEECVGPMTHSSSHRSRKRSQQYSASGADASRLKCRRLNRSMVSWQQRHVQNLRNHPYSFCPFWLLQNSYHVLSTFNYAHFPYLFPFPFRPVLAVPAYFIPIPLWSRGQRSSLL